MRNIILLGSTTNKTLLRWTPQPVIVTIRDDKDYIRVLLHSYYTTMTGWGVLLTNNLQVTPVILMIQINVNMHLPNTHGNLAELK